MNDDTDFLIACDVKRRAASALFEAIMSDVNDAAFAKLSLASDLAKSRVRKLRRMRP